MMHRDLNRKGFQEAINTTLSGLQENPFLAQRVIALEKRRKEKMRKKKLFVGLTFVLSLALAVSFALAENWQGISAYLKNLGSHPDLIAAQPTGEGEPTRLRIYQPSDQTEVGERFMAENPDIRVEYVDTLPGDGELWSYLTDSKANGLKDIDIFFVWSETGISPELLDLQGMAAPIQDSFLRAHVDAMVPVIREYLTVDGALMGYPELLYSHWNRVDRTALASMGFGEPAADFSTYLAQMSEWWKGDYRQEGDGALTVGTFDGASSLRDEKRRAMEMLVTLRLEAASSWEIPVLDTEENVAWVEQICVLSEGAEVRMSAENGCLYNTNDFGPIFGAYGNRYDHDAYIEPIRLDAADQPSCHCELYYDIINPNSPHVEAAERYLAFLANQELPIPYRYSMFPQADPAVEYGKVAIPQEAVNRYGEALPSFRIPKHQALIYQLRRDDACILLMNRLLDGEITPSQYLNGLEVRLNALAAHYRMDHSDGLKEYTVTFRNLQESYGPEDFSDSEVQYCEKVDSKSNPVENYASYVYADGCRLIFSSMTSLVYGDADREKYEQLIQFFENTEYPETPEHLSFQTREDAIAFCTDTLSKLGIKHLTVDQVIALDAETIREKTKAMRSLHGVYPKLQYFHDADMSNEAYYISFRHLWDGAGMTGGPQAEFIVNANGISSFKLYHIIETVDEEAWISDVYPVEEAIQHFVDQHARQLSDLDLYTITNVSNVYYPIYDNDLYPAAVRIVPCWLISGTCEYHFGDQVKTVDVSGLYSMKDGTPYTEP